MAIDSIGSVNSSRSTISLQDFMQVLMTQLTYQDPLKPMDNQQFLAQIAQFTSLEQTQQINTNIKTLLAGQGVQQSLGLMGRTVTFTSQTGPQTGTVSSIDLSTGLPQMTLTLPDGNKIPNVSLGQITSIQ